MPRTLKKPSSPVYTLQPRFTSTMHGQKKPFVTMHYLKEDDEIVASLTVPTKGIPIVQFDSDGGVGFTANDLRAIAALMDKHHKR